MSGEPQSLYRSARRAFIAACEAAHVDPVARLHPAKSPDGKPLFMDAAALGPRHAARAMLVVAQGAGGAGRLTALPGCWLPPDARLVLVHALDPAAFAGVKSDPGWPPAMLGAVATEDLAKVRALGLMFLDGDSASLMSVLQALLPGTEIEPLRAPADIGALRAAVAAFFGQ